MEIPQASPNVTAAEPGPPIPQWPPCPPSNTLPNAPPQFTKVYFKRFERKKTTRKEALFFEIEVSRAGMPPYTIVRRFAHLKLWHEWMALHFPEIRLPQLPAKLSTFLKTPSDEGKSRASALQFAVNTLLTQPYLKSSPMLSALFGDHPDTDPNMLSYPYCGSLYLNVVELIRCEPLGAMNVRVFPAMQFLDKHQINFWNSRPVRSGEKIFSEYLSYVQQRNCSIMLQLVGPAGGYAGCFAEIDPSCLTPYQLYDVIIPFQGSRAPAGSAVHVFVQFSPMNVPSITTHTPLSQIRIQINKDTYLPGDTVRGNVIFSNPLPCPMQQFELLFQCRQQAEWISALGGTMYKTVELNQKNLVHSRRCLATSAGSNGVLPVGFRVLPFEFAIPRDVAPTIFTSWNPMTGKCATEWKLSLNTTIPGHNIYEVPIWITNNGSGLKFPTQIERPRLIQAHSGPKFEDHSELPQLLVMGQSYHFKFKIENNGGRDLKSLTIQWVSQVLTYVPTADKYADVATDLASRTLMHKQPVLIRQGASFEIELDFRIPFECYADFDPSMAGSLIMRARNVAQLIVHTDGSEFSQVTFDHKVGAPVFPTELYPNSSVQVRPGVKTAASAVQCPAGHPHFPFSMYTPLPPMTMAELGQNPMRPVSSWISPLNRCPTIAVLPTNIIVPPNPEFATNTKMFHLRALPRETAVEYIRQAAIANPTDAKLCEVLLEALDASDQVPLAQQEQFKLLLESIALAQSVRLTSGIKWVEPDAKILEGAAVMADVLLQKNW